MAPKSPYIFAQTIAQRGQSFSRTTGYFAPPLNGTYVIHLSSAVKDSKQINFFAQINFLKIGLRSTSTNISGMDTLSRDFIYTLAQGTQTYLNLANGTASCGPMRQASWSAFLLDNLMKPLVAFHVGRDSSFYNIGKVDFNIPLIQTGCMWNSTTRTFTATHTGIYVFSLSCATQGNQYYDVFICINGMPTHELMLASTTHNGIDMSSRTVVMFLATGDEVYIELVSGSLYSDAGYLTSFAGFLYEPLDGRKVIWSVHQRSSVSGQLNPFPFDEVAVNIGNGWNATSNRFVAPYSGVYQLHLTVTIQPFSTINYQLVRNGGAYANVYGSIIIHNGYETRSRSIMIDALVGDIFNIISNLSASNLYSNQFRLISFSGFLLCP